jgi:hypothetical protein
MMRIFVVILALLANVFAANMLSMSVNENNELVEMNLAFDSAFEGAIEQNATDKNVTLKISGISIDSKKDLSLSQNWLVGRAVMTKDGATGVYLTLETKKEVAIEALKNNDGYKLQLKLTPKPAATDVNVTSNKMAATAKPVTNTSEPEFGWRYIVVVSFLTFLVAIMFYIKKKYTGRKPAEAKATKESWLLPKDFKAKDIPSDEVNIITQSFLDPNNKLMLVEYNNIKYLLLVGSTNVVVDRYYGEDAQIEGNDFKRIMAENERKLSEFLKPQAKISEFDAYRSKAEGDF